MMYDTAVTSVKKGIHYLAELQGNLMVWEAVDNISSR
jgi:hypothetical protein